MFWKRRAFVLDFINEMNDVVESFQNITQQLCLLKKLILINCMNIIQKSYHLIFLNEC